MDKVNIEFNPQFLDVVLKSLAKQPYEVSAPVIHDIQKQVQEQTKEIEDES